MTVSVILAAGASQRMGKPKALLEINNTTFLQHIIHTYRQSRVEKIIVVLGSHAREIENMLSGMEVTVTLNDNYRAGQLSSILAGINAAENFHADAALLHPVDHPLVSVDVIHSLLDGFENSTQMIVLPVFKGKRGHPVLFSRKLFEELKNAPPEIRARSLVWSHQNSVLEIETKEPGVIIDIDTPEDYARLRQNTH